MSSSGKGFHFNEGDWTCPECSNVNFARRSQCNRCGAERKYEVKKIKKGGIEIGKSAAEKSKGLFSAEDWMCKTCGNVNWARRSDCNMCNTPKVDIQDERTGFAGGFNERAGVEYKEKEDSDGEYDEFGRKKKRFRGKLAINETNKNSEEQEEDDDEESGSDEDVSKYDLGADDEDEDDDAETGKYDLGGSESGEEETKSKSKSRSRSRSRSDSRKNGKYSSRSRSRSNSRSKRRRRSSSSCSNSSRGDRRHKHRHHHHHKKSSRSRSRSPHHRRRRSSSSDRHKHRR